MMLTVDAPYVVPNSPRVEINQDAGWRFAFAPSGTPQTPGFNDSSWAPVNLPHTWNNIDGASTNYAAGNGWYRKTINVDASLTSGGKRLYLDFEGGSLVTSLYIDGTQIDYNPATAAADPHNGGFGDFLFDVTTQLTPGSHVIAVQVNNSGNTAVAPANRGDYSKEGGLYRDVTLLALPPVRVTRRETFGHTGLAGADTTVPVSTPGVYFNNSNVVIGAASATVTIRTVLDNNLVTAPTISVTSYLVDAAGIVRTQQTTNQTLAGSTIGTSITQTATIANPHLWDGRIDPYLYTLYVEVRDGSTGTILDTTSKKVGIRSFTINANAANNPSVAPFLLNGHRYTLVGANLHQDSGRLDSSGNPVGWAQSDAQIRADIDMMIEMGATVVRTSHYQQNQALYDYCDQVGLMVYTESPINGSVTAGDAFLANAQDQYQELIRQTYNNPSVFAWGFGNETDNATASVTAFRQLNGIAHGLDSSRKTAFAQYGGSNSSSTNLDGVSDIKGTHRYDYWYVAPEGATKVQQTLNAYPTQPLGITEFGGGGSAYQYADSFTLPVSAQAGGVTTHYHPANQQALLEQMQMTQYSVLNNLWGRIVWQMFDMGSSGKNEGDQGGINDKGLGTRDRTRKDAFYYYKSIWNDPTRNYANAKVIYVGDRYWATRNQAATTITAYSNLGAPTLLINGSAMGVMSPLVVTTLNGQQTVANTYVMNVTLPAGANTVTASRAYTDGNTYSDSAVFTFRSAAAFEAEQVVASGVVVNRTFSYNPTYKTTSNPFNYALPNGVYDVRITSPAGGANNLSLEGQTAAIDSNGLATADTFYARVIVADGQLTIAGAPGAYNPAVTSIDIRKADVTAPDAAATINSGDVQRSRIEALGIQFTEPVTIGSTALALSLRDTTAAPGATYALTAANPSGDGKTFVLSLSNGSPLTSLIDGVYDLTVNPSRVADLSGNTMTAVYTSTFYRLFADIDGNKAVDFNDFLIFQNAFNTTRGSAGFVSGFDFDNNDLIDFNDFLSLQNNFGKTTVIPTARQPTNAIRLTRRRV